MLLELLAQSCPTLCNPMNYSPPGSSVHGILQARILEWVAIPFSKVNMLLRWCQFFKEIICRESIKAIKIRKSGVDKDKRETEIGS